jgi:hypothetical protein
MVLLRKPQEEFSRMNYKLENNKKKAVSRIKQLALEKN